MLSKMVFLCVMLMMLSISVNGMEINVPINDGLDHLPYNLNGLSLNGDEYKCMDCEGSPVNELYQCKECYEKAYLFMKKLEAEKWFKAHRWITHISRAVITAMHVILGLCLFSATFNLPSLMTGLEDLFGEVESAFGPFFMSEMFMSEMYPLPELLMYFQLANLLLLCRPWHMLRVLRNTHLPDHLPRNALGWQTKKVLAYVPRKTAEGKIFEIVLAIVYGPLPNFLAFFGTSGNLQNVFHESRYVTATATYIGISYGFKWLDKKMKGPRPTKKNLDRVTLYCIGIYAFVYLLWLWIYYQLVSYAISTFLYIPTILFLYFFSIIKIE